MATTDIVARLQLKAEQFSSETGSAFAEMKARARSTAQDVRGSFGSAFADVQKLAATSLQMPRTTGGGLDLSREIAQLNASAAAAEESAAAQRTLSAAFLTSATTVGANTQEFKLHADAAMVAATASEREATAMREKIAMYEAVQRELDQTTVATRRMTTAQEATTRAARGNFSMVGAQLTDFTVQVQSGQSVVTAFTQQFGQMGFALKDAGGKLGALGGFLVGPWGSALTIAAMVAAPFVAKLWENSAAAEAAKKASEDLASTVGDIGTFFDLATGKIKETNQALIQYAALTDFIENKDRRKAREKLATEGRNLLAESQKPTPATSYTQNGMTVLSVERGQPNRDLASIFANGPNRAGIDAELRAVAQSASTNAATAKRILEIRATTAKSLQESEKDQAKIRSLVSGTLDASLRAPSSKKRGDKGPSAAAIAARDESVRDAQDKLAAIRDRFSDTPAQLRTVRDSLREIDDVIRGLSARKGVGFEQAIKDAEALKPMVRDALNKPFNDYLDQQRESLAVGELALAGREAEAEAMQAALRIQQMQGALSDEQLQTILATAEQHERIRQALEDQQRIVGVYTGMVGDLQASFRTFLDDLDGNTGSALKGLFDGWAADLKAMQRSLLTNALFGGVAETVEKHIKEITGRQSPAEMIASQAKEAGLELRNRVKDTAGALGDFGDAVRSVTAQLGGSRLAGMGAVGDGKAIGDEIARVLVREAFDNVATNAAAARGEVYDPNVITVTGERQKEAALAVVSSSEVLSIAIRGVAGNLKDMGLEVPKSIVNALEKHMPDVLAGLSYGQLGGSVFSSLTGGKDNKLASTIGGTLGNVAGKALGGSITSAIGGTLGKTLGGAAGPIGSIVGGILGNMVGGLFNKPQYGTAILTNASDKASATGRGSTSTKAASGMAGSVQQGLSRLAEQLGATLGTFDTVVGMFDGKYRVRTTAAGWDGKGALDFKGNSKNNLVDFGQDEQAAIAFAIADAVRDGAIKGLSAASTAILRSGSDLEAAVQKVMLIEAIPQDLKAMLDPVGAAVDALNRKWIKTKAALQEGGASAEQMAQAQRLYNLQLDQTLNSTQVATATLRDFRDGLKLGSNSPYSLRDQEATARDKLAPFLQQIAAGQSIDQEKYRSAADAFLSVERELYGSTQAYFDALDTVQAATAKAIASIDNAAPIMPPVDSPFPRATADNTATTAKATTTLTEQTDDTNALLGRIAALMERVAANTGGSGSDFVGTSRSFVAR